MRYISAGPARGAVAQRREPCPRVSAGGALITSVSQSLSLSASPDIFFCCSTPRHRRPIELFILADGSDFSQCFQTL